MKKVLLSSVAALAVFGYKNFPSRRKPARKFIYSSERLDFFLDTK